MDKNLKQIYGEYEDRIWQKRYNSPFRLRRYVHRKQYQTILKYVKRGMNVLDSGCGEGVLSVLMAQKDARVTACDISEPNIRTAERMALNRGVGNRISFLTADVENHPFEDDTFDLVISSHVLEHLPNFNQGLTELRRLTRDKAVIAVPTCFNPCAVVLLGGDVFWKLTKRTPFAWAIGSFRLLGNICNDGINEWYSGNEEMPHLWRWPWVFKRQLRESGFEILDFQASSIGLPYFDCLLPIVKHLDKFKDKPLLRNFGYGSIAYVEKG